jgi:hypothetical protein
MQSSWEEPCWSYDELDLDYHLRRPSVERELLLGLENETTGELVAFYAFMCQPLVLEGRRRVGAFGSFLTAANTVRRSGAARSVQVRLLEMAMARGYQEYVAFCEVGSISRHSIAQSCAALGLTTRVIATVSHLALPSAVIERRFPGASSSIRAYQPADQDSAAALPEMRPQAVVEARYERRDADHRFRSPLGRTYVMPAANGIAALAHFVLLEIRDGGKRFRNAYLRDLELGGLSETEQQQFLADVLAAVGKEGCYLVIAPTIATFPTAARGWFGFRPLGRHFELLHTDLVSDGQARIPTTPATVALELY